MPMKKLVEKNGSARDIFKTGEYKLEFDRLNDRITTVASVFNSSIEGVRLDLRKLDDRVHGLLEEGIISSLKERVLKIEEQTALLPQRSADINEIKLDLAKIGQKVSGIMWALAITVGPAVAYLVTSWLIHLFGTVPK